jgi:hypothetical protein
MTSSKRRWVALAAVTVVAGGSQLIPPVASADPTPGAQGDAQQPVAGGQLHNITYRARIDGVSRGATISYTAEGDQTQTANPTMLPGRTFEAQTVLPLTDTANMKVSIQWPYSANLHCEILVDDTIVAQADDFIAPRVLPNREDPDYGAIACQAPVAGAANTVPGDPGAGGNTPPPPTDGGAPVA